MEDLLQAEEEVSRIVQESHLTKIPNSLATRAQARAQRKKTEGHRSDKDVGRRERWPRFQKQRIFIKGKGLTRVGRRKVINLCEFGAPKHEASMTQGGSINVLKFLVQLFTGRLPGKCEN